MECFKNPAYLDNIAERLNNTIQRGHGIQPGTLPPSFVAENITRAVDNGMEFDVTYMDVKDEKTSFVMCCYPDIEELDNKMNDIVDAMNSGSYDKVIQTWFKIKKWHIEVDKRLLVTGTPITVDNGQQFVAILCHEIGHALNANPAQVYNNYRVNKATSNLITKALLFKHGKVIRTLLVPMFVCVNGLRIIINTPGNELSEIHADSRIPDNYKSYLVDYAENHILKYPTASKCIVTKTEFDNEVKQGVEFSRNCIDLMKRRTALLKIHINTFGRFTQSPTLKKVVDLLQKNVTPDNIVMEHAIMESFNRDYDIAEKEANTILETKMISDRDLLLLQCDIDGIKNQDDKIYVLNTIYDYLEVCQKQEEKLSRKYKDTYNIVPELQMVQGRLATLKKMAQDVSNHKIEDEVYSVYVKYPKGYEG